MSFSFITENLKLCTSLGTENSTTTFHKVDKNVIKLLISSLECDFGKFHYNECSFKCFLEENPPIPGELKQLLKVTAVEIRVLPQILNSLYNASGTLN